MEYKDLISRMKSVRNYKKDALNEDIIKKLEDYSEKSKRLVKDIKIEAMIKNRAEKHCRIQ